MIINNTNIFIISTWVLMFICVWGWKRTKTMPDSPFLRDVLWGGWKHMLSSAAPEPPTFPTDLLSTVLYLELCKLFSRGIGKWVTLIMGLKNSQPVSKKWFLLQTSQGVTSGCSLPWGMNSWLGAITLEGSGILQRSCIKLSYFDWALLSLAGSSYCGASKGRCRIVCSL